jgi:threonine aldolase
MKYSFYDVQPESAHPEIIKYLFDCNLNSFTDPEKDPLFELGVKRIKKAFDIPDADIYYFPNGTVTNVTALSSMLAPFEAVICPDTGHINNYEAGAFEATGHKIITVDTPDGKLVPAQIESVLERHNDPMMVRPKAVYLTQITEKSTVYTRKELASLIACAKKHGLYTYVDGSRLAMAIACKSADTTMRQFGALDVDMFYIGGGKNGALYGEALVINNNNLKSDFCRYMKRQGAAVGKQRPLDLQFARFFADDNLWIRLAEHANAMGERLRAGLVEIGAGLVQSSDANHAFVVMKNDWIDKLEKDFGFERWQKLDNDNTKIRLVCGWATQPENVDDFLQAVKALRIE